MIIQVPALDELPALRAIERAAGEPFRGLGMATVADDEPPPLELLTEFQRAGRALAAYEEAGPGGGPAARSPTCSGSRSTAAPISSRSRSTRPGPPRHRPGPHRPGGAGRRPRRADPDHLHRSAVERPYYARIGFRTLPEAELTPGLRAIRAHEAALGLDRWPRVAMRREVDWEGVEG